MHLSTSNVERDSSYLRVLSVDSLRTANCGVSHDGCLATGGDSEFFPHNYP